MQPFKYRPKRNSGTFRHWVTIQKPPGPDDVDGVGQPLDDFIKVDETWAAIEPLRGRELFSAQQANVEITTRITIRYQPDVDRSMEILYNGIKFEILYIINPEFADLELQLMCRERQ